MLIIHQPQEQIISQALTAHDGLVWSVSAVGHFVVGNLRWVRAQ